MKTVVVTGFGPFGSHQVNSSWEAVKTLANKELKEDGIQLVIEQIPVEYTTVKKRVPELWHTHKPTLVVHVGVSSYAEGLVLEQQAHNEGYCKLDIRGSTPEDFVCVSGVEDCLQAGIDMSSICDKINASGTKVKAEVSHDPGRYLCDFSYFTSLHIDHRRCAFIHVPPLDKQYTVEELAEGLRVAILSMLNQLQD